MPQYLARSPPSVETVEDLKAWLDQELQAISLASADQNISQLNEQFAPPQRPRDGMIAFADGTKWNPGGSPARGLYFFRDGTWHRLTGS